MSGSKSKIPLFLLLLMNFFTFALITNFVGALLPYWKESFNLSNSIIALLGSAFFVAYGLTSLPQGFLLDSIGNKKTLIWALSLLIGGSVLFGLFPSFEVGIISLFIIGTGVTAIQMVGNLLVKKLDDDPNKYSRNLTFMQALCGVGGSCAGFLIGLTTNTLGLEWKAAYFIFAGFTTLILLLALAVKIPETEKTEQTEKPTAQDYFNLLKNSKMVLFAAGIFIYVGIEVAIYTWLATFLIEVHGFEKATAAGYAGLYWALQAVGRFTGGIVLNFLNTSKALILYSIGCLLSLYIATLAPQGYGMVSLVAFIAAGFFTSIMFPSIFTLAVNSFGRRQEATVAGILCTSIIGGAVITPIVGVISDVTGSLGTGLIVAGTASLLYLAFVGFKTLTPVVPATAAELQAQKASGDAAKEEEKETVGV